MLFHQLSPQYQENIRHYIAGALPQANRFHFDIHPNDEMFHRVIAIAYKNNPDVAYFKYLESGKRTLDVVRQIADQVFGGFANIPSYLEFACGHGRFTRYLLQEMPAECITVSDIYPDAVSWHQETFGVRGFNSFPDPALVKEDRKHRMIVAGSLFSHFPDGLFGRWLHTLYDMLDEDGILVLSLHSDRQLPQGKSMEGKALQFYNFSESKTLTHDIYGQSYVTDAYMLDQIRAVTGRANPDFALLKKTFYENQDVYVIGRNPARHLSSLAVNITPLGGLSKVNHKHAPQLTVRGWGMDLNEGHTITRIELLVDGKVVGTSAPYGVNEAILQYFPGAPNLPVVWEVSGTVPAGAAPGIVWCRIHSSAGPFCDYYIRRPGL